MKERLTGAAVLVILGVLVIPVFLDGPPERPQESTRMSLPVPPPGAESGTGKVPAARTSSAPISAPVEKPPVRPATPAAGAAEDSKPAAAATQTRTEAQTPAQAQSPARTDPVTGWAVQVGSFSSQDNAERLRDRLKADGYRAFVMRHSESGRTLYRVRVGPEQDRERAEALARRLARNGQATAIVRHP